MVKRRVVVTGLGAVTPIGNNVQDVWESIEGSQSGITKITKFDASNYASQIAGEVKGFNAADHLNVKDVRRTDTFIHFGLVAGMEALNDAGIEKHPNFSERVGVYIGSGIGGLPLIEATHTLNTSVGPKKISPFFIPGSIINMIAGNLSIEYGFKGPNLAISTACTTSTHCIGESFRTIQYNDADVMVCGGSESTICDLGVGGFSAARALSTRNDDPQSASRPWDSGRDGFVLGEGSGILVLEELEHAKKRNARIYCELVGYGTSSDAHHITAPNETGEGAVRCMKNALNNGNVNIDQIDYINAHGTSTPLGDIAETNAIKETFGVHAKKLSVSSTKSNMGHLLGAAGSVEALISILALKNSCIPPAINLTNQDEKCDLDFTPLVPKSKKISYCLSNSFGFGGTNGSLVFKEYQ